MPTTLDRFRSLSPGRQVALTAALFGSILLTLIASWYFLLRTEYRPLFTALRAADASVIVADLERRKIPYRLEDDGTTVLVPDDRVDATRLSVMSEDLPLHGTVGFELFNKSDLGLTDFAQRINYQRALQGELARTILALDGVESTRVHIAIGEDRLFREDRVPPKASVTIRMRNGAALPARTAQGIQRLVAAAVPKLDPANVVILDEAGRTVVAGDTVAIELAPATVPAVPEIGPTRAASGRRLAGASPFDDHGELTLELAGSLILFVAFIVGIVAIFRMARRPRRLNEKQRAELTARLRSALDDGGAHAVA